MGVLSHNLFPSKYLTYRRKDPCQCSAVWAVQAMTQILRFRYRRPATPTARSWRNISQFQNIETRLGSFRCIKNSVDTWLTTREKELSNSVTWLPGPGAIDHRPVSLSCIVEQPHRSQDYRLKTDNHDPSREQENRRSRPFVLVDLLGVRSIATTHYCYSLWISY